MRDQVFVPGELGAGRDGVFHLVGRWAEEPIPPASCLKSAEISWTLSLPHLVPVSREFWSISFPTCFEL